jgi:hypothetical protein
MEAVTIPVVQVRPNMLLIYPYTIWPDGRPYFKTSNSAQFVITKTETQDEHFQGKQAYSGQLTHDSKKRLQKSINLLVAIAKPKRISKPMVKKPFTFSVNFVTLTLPAAQGSVTDKEIKKQCLDPWIKAMKRKHQLRSYVWRAERQFNGNVHFHFTTDTYIPQDDIRNDWNRQLSKFHFIDKFEEKHGYKTPNSTDVHAVWKIQNIAAYMVKYMSKDSETHLSEVNAKRVSQGKEPIEPQNHAFRTVIDQPKWDSPIDGKVWDCSLNLKTKERCEVEADDSIRAEINSLVKSKKLRFKSTDHCTLIFAGNTPMEKLLSGQLLQLYKTYLYNVTNFDTLEIERRKMEDEANAREQIPIIPHRPIIPLVPVQMKFFQSA